MRGTWMLPEETGAMSAEDGLSKEGWTEVFGSNYVKEL